VVLHADRLHVKSNDAVTLCLLDDLVVLDDELDVVEDVGLLVKADETDGEAAGELGEELVVGANDHGGREVVNDPVVVVLVLDGLGHLLRLLLGECLLAQNVAEVLQQHVDVVRRGLR